MRDRRTSRILNDDSFFLGLSYADISGAGIALLIVIFVFKALGIQNMIWALMMAIAGLGFVIPIRLNFRRKIIRDSLKYSFQNGVIDVSKNRRN